MARINYQALLAKVTPALKKAGQPGKLRLPAAPVPGGDPWSQTFGAPAEYNVSFVLDNYSNQDIDGTLIQRIDSIAYITASGLPLITEAVELVSNAEPTKPYAVIDLKPISPGGVVLVYQAQVRR